MAKATRRIELKTKNIEEERQEDLGAIIQQIADNRAVIQDSLTILAELHESGLLDIVKGLLAERVKVSEIAIHQVNQPGAHHIIKNSFSIIGMLASIEPKQTGRLLESLSSGLESVAQQDQADKPMSIWGLTKAMKDPGINKSIQTLLSFLKGMGDSLNEPPIRPDTTESRGDEHANL